MKISNTIELLRPEASFSENPAAWIRFVLLAILYCVMSFALILAFVILLPPALMWLCWSDRVFRRTAGFFSEAGIYFPKAYRKVTVAWSDIREVVHEQERKGSFYRVVCGSADDEIGYVMCKTQDDSAFERTVGERGIPLREHNWFDDREDKERA